jgi:hypothetical protein
VLSPGIPKEKVSDDTPIELSVHARAQWNFLRPSFMRELQPPLGPNNLILLNGSANPSRPPPLKSSNNGSCGGGPNSHPTPGDLHHKSNDSHGVNNENDESPDESWLSQVEISTHSGPHRRLWMGPQFTFKVFNPAT